MQIKVINYFSTNLFLFLCFLFVSINFAPHVFAESELIDCGTPVCIEIKDAVFDGISRETLVTLDVWNNNSSFVDNTTYSVEFHTGDVLPETGYIFGDLKYITQIKGKVPALHPNEKVQINAKLTMPITVDAGNYFLRTKIWNEDRSVYGINFSRESLEISGNGTVLPYIDAALIHPDTGIAHLLMEGPILAPTSTPKVVILEKRNQELFERLEDEEIFVSYKVTSLAKPEDVVASKERYPMGLMIRPDGGAIEIDIEPWMNMQAGPHTAYLSFTDLRGNSLVDDLEVRLLYNGFFARMYDVQTSINSYRKGEPLNINVNVLSAGVSDLRNLLLRATLTDVDDKKQVYEVTVPISGDFQGDDQWVVFGSEKIKKTAVIKEMQLELLNEQGEVYDVELISLDTDVVYSYPKKENYFLEVTALIIVLIVITLIVITFKHEKKRVVVTMLCCSLVGGAILYTSVDSVLADATLGPSDIQVSFTSGPCAPPEDDPNTPEDESEEENSNDDDCTPQLDGYLLRIWSSPSNEPSGHLSDECEDCEDVVYYVKMQCKDCGNAGLNLDVNFYNDFDYSPTKTYNLRTIINSNYMIDYGSYIVDEGAYEARRLALEDEGNSREVPIGELAGVAVAANDVINWWIWGPFVDEVCYEKTDGSTQTYNIRAATQFAPGFCELSFYREEGTDNFEFDSIDGSLDDPRDVGPSCAEMQVTKYLDDNQNGVWDTGEIFLKDTSASPSCFGTETDVRGAINHLTDSSLSTTNLESIYCNVNNEPYFLKENIVPGVYVPDISIADKASWRVTGVEPVSSFTLDHGDTSTARIGLTAADDYPVVISCVPVEDDLQVSCAPSEEVVETNEQVTWTATATGGDGSLSYNWDNGETGSVMQESYSTIGTKTETITVSDGAASAVASCSVEVVAPDVVHYGVTQGDCTDSDWLAGANNTYTTQIRGDGRRYFRIPVGTGMKRFAEMTWEIEQAYIEPDTENNTRFFTGTTLYAYLYNAFNTHNQHNLDGPTLSVSDPAGIMSSAPYPQMNYIQNHEVEAGVTDYPVGSYVPAVTFTGSGSDWHYCSDGNFEGYCWAEDLWMRPYAYYYNNGGYDGPQCAGGSEKFLWCTITGYTGYWNDIPIWSQNFTHRPYPITVGYRPDIYDDNDASSQSWGSAGTGGGGGTDKWRRTQTFPSQYNACVTKRSVDLIVDPDFYNRL